MKNVKAKTNEQIAMQVSANSIAVNLMLSIFKLIAGLLASSGAMISDAIHSASDVFSTIIVIIGVKISGKASDEDHPYGHDRFECVASIILAILLGVTGVGIGLTGVQKLIAGHYDTLAIPGILALAAAVISIVVKEIMYWYTRNAAKKINSGALMADAWHHRSDALSSVGSFVGIFGARMGFPMLDPLASVVICLFVVKAAVDIFRDAISKMTDRSCDQKTVNEMHDCIMNIRGVEGIDLLKTRSFGSKYYVDIEISADGNKKLWETHAIAENVHQAIEHQFPLVKHCMVHVNPA
ncbi:MAG: cation diffusion facilitator family transporter [Coprococcus sp.]|uniref:cation diffusion facilitator family transporter n=1 Tax=Coprococcus catus TaxID=116085 RepID=UPI001C038D49|nr:cation diffusion facilitator family transporter [Coprococcus catus]MBT9772667.1 cation diffusion facilitator family transporter [Coprococcus catus]MEE0142159.1 cation diffusion facilitator family transporter [Coprococcus sp.]